jgi:beta-phosphoglucomutase-like phosphatase (HAD superfamily)
VFGGLIMIFALACCSAPLVIAVTTLYNAIKHFKGGYLRIAGISDIVDVVTSADDAERSKPAPDILRASLKSFASKEDRLSPSATLPTTRKRQES